MDRHKILSEKIKGFSILEILIGLLILIFVIIGFMKGAADFMFFLKAEKINSRAKELAEQLRSEILSLGNLTSCFVPNTEGTLFFNGTTMETQISLDTPNFYVKDCPNVINTSAINCIDKFRCLYCYSGENLYPASGTNCTVGYPIRVGYNAGRIVHIDEITGEKKEIGIAVGIKVYYTEPKTKREKEINMLIFKKIE